MEWQKKQNQNHSIFSFFSNKNKILNHLLELYSRYKKGCWKQRKIKWRTQLPLIYDEKSHRNLCISIFFTIHVAFISSVKTVLVPQDLLNIIEQNYSINNQDHSENKNDNTIYWVIQQLSSISIISSSNFL